MHSTSTCISKLSKQLFDFYVRGELESIGFIFHKFGIEFVDRRKKVRTVKQ
jgi:hypothetical protein